MNAIKVENSSLNLRGNTSIEVGNDGYAFYALSETAGSNIYIEINNGNEINGAVYYADTYSKSRSDCSFFTLNKGTINGEIQTSGNKYTTIIIENDAVYNGTRVATARTWAEVENLVYNHAITTIELMNPIVVNGNVSIDFERDRMKTIRMHKDFSWEVDGEELDALFINNGERLEIMNFNIIGSDNSSNPKYLLKSTKGVLKLDYVAKLDANGLMNGIKIENSNLWLNGDSSIDIEGEDSYALYIHSETANANVDMFSDTKIIGDVYYLAGYKGSRADYFNVDNGVSILGDLAYGGAYAPYWNVTIRDDEDVIGAGWDDWFLVKLQQQLTDNGQASISSLTLDEDVTLFFDGSQENIYLTIQKIDGTGRLSFNNISEKEVYLSTTVNQLSDDVAFAFTGDFRKNFTVTTNRVKDMFEMAADRDVITVNLESDAAISEEINPSEGLKDGKDGGWQGRLHLNLLGWTLNWNAPLKLTSGILNVGDYGQGTINASSEFIHAGANYDENNNNIAIIFSPYLTVNSSQPWIKAEGLNEDLSKNKKISVYLPNVPNVSDKASKVITGVGYSKEEGGNVTIQND